MADEGDRSAAVWRERAATFTRERLDPVSAEIDASDHVPSSILEGLASEGFLGIGLPVEFGGRGEGARATVAVLEELSKGNAAVATMTAVHLSVAAAPIARWGTLAQKETYLRPLTAGKILGAFALTEPSAGSDAARIATRYERIRGGFRLRGAKTFITDADIAGVVLAFATRDPELGHKGISAFLVPRGAAGFTVAQRLPKLGLHGSTTTELLFDGTELPEAALLGPEGDGFKVALDALTGGRVGIAACALGVARAAMETMRESARRAPEDWKSAAVARAFVEIEAAAALVEAAARAKDLGGAYVPLASAAKLAASRACVAVASRAMDVEGRGAGTRGSRAERLLRDARVFPIVEGTTEIQELILGRELVGR
ncbi:MAG: acyl-CoA dehydrogenase family protein [Thermoplasmata archaeon]|nr:acyl-CoA dehydrogenase family protein [Thermoplasmata archaeon]